MGHIQWPVACDPSYLCGALLRAAVLDYPGWPNPLNLANEELKFWNARVQIQGLLKLAVFVEE